MTLSQPGPFWYKAVMVAISGAVGSFAVTDAAGNPHNGLAIDRVTVQQYLEVSISGGATPDFRALVRQALQDLVLAEYGGDLAAAIAAVIAQGVEWE